MNIQNYKEAVDTLYSHLEEYLEDQGIDTTKNFKCILPSHDDKNPSMGLVPSKLAFHCFGCGASGGIFNACAYLEDKPANGPGFIPENLMYLAEKYDVELEHAELTEEELYELDTHRAYRITADSIVSGSRTKRFDSATKSRGWSREICDRFGVGCVASYKHHKDVLKKAGFTVGFLGDVDLDRTDIFSEDCVIFTIRDDHGRPVGFASRNLNFNGEKKNGSKFVNQRGTGVKCNIYRKSERLFGLDQVLKNKGKGQESVYIFEGYGDVVTAAEHGLDTTCGIGGTALTEEHVLLLKKHNIYNIILCLDGDTAGRRETARLLDERLGSHKDLSIYVMVIPEDLDPDEYIRTHGIDKFKEIKKWTAFEWRLNQFEDTTEAEDICKSMIPLIVNETSYIQQEKMSTALAKATSITLKTIQRELGRLQNAKEAKIDRDRSVILDSLSTSLRKTPADAEYAIQEAKTSLLDLSKRYELDSLSADSCLDMINKFKSHQESLDGKFTGFRLGLDLQIMEKAFNANWKKDIWFCLGGKPNCIAKEQLILDPDTGRLSTLDKISRVNSIELENDNALRIERVSDYIDSEKQECFEVISSTGHTAMTTAKHRFYTPNGWKILKELSPGDTIAQPAQLVTESPSEDPEFSVDQSIFLGLMLGDGNMTQPRPLFTNDDPVILERIKELAVGIFGDNIQCPVYDTDTENPTYEMIGFTQSDWKRNRDEGGRCLPNPVTNWFKMLGLFGKTAHDKHIPERLFSTTNRNLMFLLKGLFSTDGSIYLSSSKGHTRYTIEYSSVSEILIKQVQHLLLRFGIVSSIRRKRSVLNGKEFHSWLLSIRDRLGVTRFISEIGFLGRKETLAKSLDIKITQGTLNKSKYDGSIYWSKIKSITPIGIKETCDITVNKTHNFCLDGFVLHNSGKTSFLCKLLLEIAGHKENNVCVIYHTIDDTFEQVLPKFVCVAGGTKKLTINQVNDPNYHKKEGIGENIEHRRNEGYGIIQDLVREGKLMIKDANDGNGLAYADKLITYAKEKYPDRDIVYVLDNFHKLSDLQSIGKDERVRFKEMSKIAKGLATSHHCCVITTIEYKKIEGEPDNNSIAETGQIEYDANIIGHVYNEVHESGDAAVHRFEHDFENGEGKKICPRISIKIGKNKVSGFKNKLWFDFYPECSDFRGVSAEDVAKDAVNAKKANMADDSARLQSYLSLRTTQQSKGHQEGYIWINWMKDNGFDPNDPEQYKEGGKIFDRIKIQAALS